MPVGREFLREPPPPGAVYDRTTSFFPDDLDVGTEAGLYFWRIAHTRGGDEVPQLPDSQREEMIRLEAREAIASGDLDKAEQLLRYAMEVRVRLREDYAALVALRRGKAFDPRKELDALRIGIGSRPFANGVGRLLFRAAGDYAATRWNPARQVSLLMSPSRRRWDRNSTSSAPTWKPRSTLCGAWVIRRRPRV